MASPILSPGLSLPPSSCCVQVWWALTSSKSLAPCPSLSYWLRATAMVPVTLLTLLGVR